MHLNIVSLVYSGFSPYGTTWYIDPRPLKCHFPLHIQHLTSVARLTQYRFETNATVISEKKYTLIDVKHTQHRAHLLGGAYT